MRLGWDDEQVTIWFNRQIDPAAATLDAQLGVFGYRIDARIVGDPKWHSLCRARGPVKVDKVDLGTFDGELGVETHPAQLDGQKTGDYWLPMYFTSWTGPGLATLDTVTMVLSGDRDRADPTRVQALPPEVALRYGKDYEFRVRLMDHTGGGPPPDAKATIPGPAPVATIPFRRWIRPMRLRLQNPPPPDPDPAQPPAVLTVRRPLLGHPAVVLTGAYSDPITALRADIAAAQAEGREVGLPDPDVVSVQIVVQAQGLAQDPLTVDSGYLTLYQTTRSFPSDPAQPLSIDLTWVDVHDALVMTAPAAGPLPLPTARNVRLLLHPLGRNDPQSKYFGAENVRLGPPITVSLRKHSGDERNLFAPDLPTHRFSALFLQPDPVVDATVLFAQRAAGSGGQRPSDVPSRLAAQLDLRNDGLTFRARSGRRVVFGCAPSLRHVIGPDNASITFASQSDLVKHWLVVVRLTLDRDWTWDGLAHDGLVVERDGQVVGRFGPTRNVGTDALVAPERSQTDLVFFDAVDPKPAPGAFPSELKILYNIRAELVGAPQKDNPLPLGIRLPVTTPPAQRPQLVSAGIAMSPYVRSADYSSTEPRRRALWLEFDRPPDDPHDRYFARVLRNAPDPLLSSSLETVPETAEAPLAVDPEWIRVVAQDQADDRSGLGAMQELTPSDSPVHFAAPLPAGLTEDSSELFGFFTYELRVGHKTEWTTAQGRYGPPLRVTGVQHPAPALSCAVVRNSLGIIVSAPFAVPVFDGRSVQADKPRSQIWVLLYAQAERMDGQERCNVLLGRKPAPWTGFSGGGRTNEFGTATFGDAEIQLALEALALANEAPLSVLAVELLPNGAPVVDPLGIDLGAQRILRTSPLIPVPAIC